MNAAVEHQPLPEGGAASRLRRCVGMLSFQMVRFLVAGVLLIAAVLKTFDPMPDANSWFARSVVFGELFLAIWLISGLFPRHSRTAVIAVFWVFAVISATSILGGVTNCGCFGVLPTSPWISFSIDVTVILIVGKCCPTDSGLPTKLVLRGVVFWTLAYIALAAFLTNSIPLKNVPNQVSRDRTGL